MLEDNLSRSESRIFKTSAYAQLAEVGKALGNGTRIELLELLAQAPLTVEALAAEVGQSVANTSHHLQALKRAQLVVAERQANHVRYSLASDEVAALVLQLERVASKHVAALERLTHDYFAERDTLEALDQATLLARMRAQDVTVIDVRSDREYQRDHIPGAVSIPLAELEQRLAELPRDQTIVAYCRGPYCALSASAATRLRELGYDARRTDATAMSLRLAGVG
jgi:ArsR family transcriptional regulator